MINHSLNILIISLVLITVGTETYTYWLMKIRPWQPDSPVGRIIFYYSFFTVLSNIYLAISSAFLVINPKANSQLFRIIWLDGLVGVLITAIVYNAVLRGIHQPPTPILQMANESLLLIVPALGLLSWLIYGPYPRIDRKTVILSCIPLIVYDGYIFIRGHITGQYLCFLFGGLLFGCLCELIIKILKNKKSILMKSKYIKLIHIAKKQLNLDDDTYRRLLTSETKKTSTKDMTVWELEKVIKNLKTKGFKVKSNSRKEKITATEPMAKEVLDNVDEATAQHLGQEVSVIIV